MSLVEAASGEKSKEKESPNRSKHAKNKFKKFIRQHVRI